jgi:hypothetical protein
MYLIIQLGLSIQMECGGDYFDANGKWLRNDGNDDHKVYLTTQYGGPSPWGSFSFDTEIKGITIEELVDMAAIAYGESSGNKLETYAFANAIKNNMDANNESESDATDGNFSYAKSNNEPKYANLKKSSNLIEMEPKCRLLWLEH